MRMGADRANLLVIVPCGREKTWDKVAETGPTQAGDAYLGTPFVVNKSFAEQFGDAWMILSAKYGFCSRRRDPGAIQHYV